ncbi:cytidine deaminase [Candidatus Saccharibacteria bacterium]|nr:cytidine deaminase [Candidatus Saccharibacteria bacterium]
MPTDEIIKKLIDAATAMVNQYGDEKTCFVAASALSQDGSITTSLNFHHFADGPCAEIALLARLASEGKRDPKIIVAVGDKSRGVITPCGRCRQILIDNYPSIEVIVSNSDKPHTVSISELLPDPYIRSS